MMKSLNRTPWYLICPAPFFKRFCYSLKNHLKELKERLFYEEEKSCAQLVCAIYTSLAEVYYFFVKGMGFKKADKRKRGITWKYSFFIVLVSLVYEKYRTEVWKLLFCLILWIAFMKGCVSYAWYKYAFNLYV